MSILGSGSLHMQGRFAKVCVCVWSLQLHQQHAGLTLVCN